MANVSATPALSELVSVFGGNGALSSYARGAGLVPDTPANAAISTTVSGLALSQFANASNTPPTTSGTVALSNRNVSDYVLDGGASAAINFMSDGTLIWTTNGNGSGNVANEWMRNGTASNYELLVTTTGGTVGTGTVGTWLNLGTTRTYSRNRAVAGQTWWTFTAQIRAVGTTTVLATATISLSAERQNSGGGGVIL